MKQTVLSYSESIESTVPTCSHLYPDCILFDCYIQYEIYCLNNGQWVKLVQRKQWRNEERGTAAARQLHYLSR